MNIFDIGVDIIEIDRIRKVVDKNNRFLEKIFIDREIEYFNFKNFKVESIVGNFVVKEVISKFIGIGIRVFNFKDIEVFRNEMGKLIVKIYNNLVKMCIDYNVLEIKVLILYLKDYVIVNVIIIIKD